MALEPITRQEQIISGKDLQPITRMEMFLKEYGGGGSGGGAQPDWNQNDSTKPDYVKNRTHWTDDPVETVLFDGNVTTVAEDWGNTGFFDPPIELTGGQEYIVVFNGVEYKCVANTTVGGTVHIGNSTENPKEFNANEPPFMILFTHDGPDIFSDIFTQKAGTYALKITENYREIHKIDRKYLPSEVMFGGEWDAFAIKFVDMWSTLKSVGLDISFQRANGTEEVEMSQDVCDFLLYLVGSCKAGEIQLLHDGIHVFVNLGVVQGNTIFDFYKQEVDYGAGYAFDLTIRITYNPETSIATIEWSSEGVQFGTQ
jgi:hypothetical protein